MAYADSAQTERSNRRYISAAMDAPVLEREYEVDLAKRWNEKREERAMHEIIEAHARLVVRIAAGFRSSGLPMADLMQEGNIGLMEAVERFDHEREVRFSTYASWWIVASIQNYILRNSSIVRAATTPKQRRLFFNLRRLRAQLSTGFDGQLTTDERQIIADKLDVTVADVERMELHLTRPDQSLNASIGLEDDGAQFQDLLEDKGPGPEDIASNASGRRTRKEWLETALDKLTPRERRIIVRRFLEEDKSTLAEIGVEFGVSKERIRQIESRALQKMHASLTQMGGTPTDLFDS